ncbi:hypothetical protein PMZ80_002999 [Knufia obscura]|uniref:Uncharacterized protein n=1 Tax=Knufia obscura TaxID=1635080 RepID=A0ABR0RYX7_9EURO|nr:hypothetical protein PMZ80_002999 [Knufia obscura]
MNAHKHRGGAQRQSTSQQEHDATSPMEDVLSSPPPLQQPFPQPQSWPPPERATQPTATAQPVTFDPSWEQIGDVVRASDHGRRNIFTQMGKQPESYKNNDFYLNNNGEISVRQQVLNLMPDETFNNQHRSPAKPPPNHVLQFNRPSQTFATSNQSPAPLSSAIQQRQHASRQLMSPQPNTPLQGLGGTTDQPQPTMDAKQAPVALTQAPEAQPDPFVQDTAAQDFEVDGPIPPPCLVELNGYSRPIQIGDEVHILDPERNDRSGMVTYIVTGFTAGGLCSIRLKADMFVPVDRLLRTQVSYLAQVSVFQPRVQVRDGKPQVRMEEVDAGLVMDRTVVNGSRRYTVVNGETGRSHEGLGDDMIGTWEMTPEQVEEGWMLQDADGNL